MYDLTEIKLCMYVCSHDEWARNTHADYQQLTQLSSLHKDEKNEHKIFKSSPQSNKIIKK